MGTESSDSPSDNDEKVGCKMFANEGLFVEGWGREGRIEDRSCAGELRCTQVFSSGNAWMEGSCMGTTGR